ncbi:probable phosphoglycerate mutase [Pseudonocardia thermophila]|jgi:Fructose-2,6-bisphosphatase|uniref:Probable phosphoglycerate mutase n=1 Tax=Pseudonocardia thermophila TaxID=1848 RepID=A0A1M6T5D1_PSETH|nr:histidine phosphatase family protein [Pseudonocardia thermophila]SHK52181.1 probable phosphoglycerate mutase [Pseudonocardia thermophila]
MLILVRHGEVAANAEGLLLGRADPPLTPTGRRQAVALAELVPRPARIVSSPLTRARETAAVLAAGEIDVEIDPRWVELDYGHLDGKPPTALGDRDWHEFRTDPDFTPPGGESLAALCRRVRESCEELAADAAHRDVVVVSHVSPIKAAVTWALGVGDCVAWRMFLGDAAISRIDTSGPEPLLLTFSDTTAAELAAQTDPQSERSTATTTPSTTASSPSMTS